MGSQVCKDPDADADAVTDADAVADAEKMSR